MNHLQSLIDDGQITDPASPRGKLLDRAAHLFLEKGYERTTVRDIATEVGIQSGSIFHHFKSKEDLLKAVMTEAILYNTKKMQSAVAAANTPKEKVLACIQCELESIVGSDTGEAMSLLVPEWRSLSPDNQEAILALRSIYEDIWMSALNAAKAAGLLSGDVFVRRRFLNGALNWTPNWFKPDGDMTMENLASEALKLVLASGGKET